MTDRDEIADLADRTPVMSEFEFAIEWESLTGAEQDEFMALMHQRTAHGREKLEAIDETNRALKALLMLNVERAPGMSLTEAIGSGRVGLLEVVEAIRAVPDPLSG
jgi:hypothetical protein